MTQILNLNGEQVSAKFTNRQLINLYQEMHDLHTSALGWILGNRFHAFKKANHAAYQKVNDDLLALQKRYFVMEKSKGKTMKDALVIKMVQGPDGKNSPEMLPGMTMEGYQQEQEVLLSKRCEIVRPRPMDY